MYTEIRTHTYILIYTLYINVYVCVYQLMIFQHWLWDATSSSPAWPTSPLPSAGSWPRLSSVGLDASLPRSSWDSPVSNVVQRAIHKIIAEDSRRRRKTASFLVRNFLFQCHVWSLMRVHDRPGKSMSGKCYPPVIKHGKGKSTFFMDYFPI